MTTNDPRSAARFIAMTNKHLANAVRFGRRVTFYCPDLPDDVVGYVCGFDDDNVRIAVVTKNAAGNPEIEVKLRNRQYIGGIDEDKHQTLMMESVSAELEVLVKGFRRKVMEEYFPQHAVRED